MTCTIKYALIAQLDRVSDYESEGRGFESLSARHKRIYPIWDISFYLLVWYERDSNTEWAKTVAKGFGEAFCRFLVRGGYRNAKHLGRRAGKDAKRICPFQRANGGNINESLHLHYYFVQTL